MTLVDIVIPTRNRNGPLLRCLESLAGQSFHDFGVIVVDDQSEQPVEQGISADLRARLPIRVLRPSHRGGPGRARNLGVEASSARYIQFIDDDVVPDPSLLEHHVERAQDAPGSFAFGRLVQPGDWQSPRIWNRWAVQKQEDEYARIAAGAYRPTWRQFFTANGFVPRDQFLEVGGFDERFTRSEDIELAFRLTRGGNEVRFVEEAVVWHHAHHSASAWLDATSQYARFDVALDRMNPEMGWLGLRQREIANASRTARLTTGAARRATLGGRGLGLLLGAAAGVEAIGARMVAMRLVSLAYNVAYESSLNRAAAKASLAELLELRPEFRAALPT